MSSRNRMAEALAQANAMGGQQGDPGLETPPEAMFLQNLSHLATGYGMGNLGATVAQALARKALPAMEAMGEAGAIFPEGTPPENLPVVPKGSKTGDPHALFAYHDDFGPNMSKRAIYNLFGDPANPALKQAGWGSSVSEDVLKKYGIPITGKEPPRTF